MSKKVEKGEPTQLGFIATSSLRYWSDPRDETSLTLRDQLQRRIDAKGVQAEHDLGNWAIDQRGINWENPTPEDWVRIKAAIREVRGEPEPEVEEAQQMSLVGLF